ncbi:HAD superfamily hydrolase Cof [Candidatus Malacoplasma girerdii]|uniref:HAD superfamily hydrolase Cof n=1 Tax=Candidatus Malacoplasma girerdii TaxID=1318617 RepID=A0A097ST46_9BACT|nr:HAD superfamily hydrolase Cof [Candidatus Malacoplasma girerdii]ASJ89279.1 MAG: haloacid dehalogenase-like hydrolase [Candidatus Malacoplasma girerdii]
MAKSTTNKNERYLIASDLDWTLLDNNGELKDLTIRTVKKLTKMGHVFCLISGRPPQAMIDIYNKLGLKSIMVSFNGSLITNPSSKNFAPINLCFNFDIVRKILNDKKLKPLINNCLIENSSGVFVKNVPNDKKLKKEILDSFHIAIDSQRLVKRISPNFANVRNHDLHSVLLHIKDKKNLDKVMYELRKFSRTLVTRLWQFNNFGYIVEINSVFASKGNALKFLSAYYSIDKIHTFSFGDGDNDTDMLHYAFNGFAMCNGSTTAKLSSTYITKEDNNNCGVARELIRAFKLKNLK